MISLCHSRLTPALLCVAIAGLCATGCKKEKAGGEGKPETAATTPAGGGTETPTATDKPEAKTGCDAPAAPPTAADGPEFVDNSIVVAWNRVGEKMAFATAKQGFIDVDNYRGWAMMHVAIHDALNAIRPVYKQHTFTGCKPDASPTAAVAQAAHDVLVEVYPSQKEALGKELETWLAKATKGKEAGVEIGKASAAAIIAARAEDGVMKNEAKYAAKPPKTGQYQMVKPLAFVHNPGLATAKSFTLTANDQFRAPPPPACGTPEYAKAFNEVKEFGGKKSKARSKEQTQYGAWWLQFPLVGWNRAASAIQAGEKKQELYAAARTYALLNMALMDAMIVVWDSKQHYDYWRPVTAIQAAAKDDNEATKPDPKWESAQVCPPIQEYPSAHASESRTAAEVLKTALGTDDVAFEFESVTAAPGAPKTRSFKKLTDAAKEAADSRVMVGYHFRFSTDAGLALGEKLGAHVATTQLPKRE